VQEVADQTKKKKGVGFSASFVDENTDEESNKKNVKNMRVSTFDLDLEPNVAETPVAAFGTKDTSFDDQKASTRFTYEDEENQKITFFTEENANIELLSAPPKAKIAIVAVSTNTNSSSDQSPQTQPYQPSAAQFRRIERSNRRYSVDTDVWCRIEFVRDIWKCPAWLLLTTFFIPLLFCIISYSSYELIETNRDTIGSGSVILYTLSTMIAIVIQSLLLVEMFSDIVCAIEFRVVVNEEMEYLPLQACFGGIFSTIITQLLLFALSKTYFDEEWDSSSHRAWLWQLIGGFIGTSIAITRCFVTYEPDMLTRELCTVFIRWLLGCAICLVILPMFYGFYTSILAQYGSYWNTFVGILLALLFPVIMLITKELTQNYLYWGEGREKLSTGPILDILISSMHSAFSCLAVLGIASSTLELIMLLISQSVCYLYQIICLQSSSNGNLNPNVRSRSMGIKTICNLQNFCECMTDSRIGIKESPASSPSKYVVTEEAVMTDQEKSDNRSGISEEAMEGFQFAKQCSKLRDISALSSSIILGAALPSIIALFIAVLNVHPNEERFIGIWSFTIKESNGDLSSGMLRLLVLWGYQMFMLFAISSWLQYNGNFFGVLQNGLIFHYPFILSGSASFATLVVVGCALKANGMNVAW
jgi:hypothetical protein